MPTERFPPDDGLRLLPFAPEDPCIHVTDFNLIKTVQRRDFCVLHV